MSTITVAASSHETLGYQEAFAMAEELDQIRYVYGEDCLTFVKKALLMSGNPDWKSLVFGAVSSWQLGHPRFDLDDISP